MKIFQVMIEDRHFDTEALPFSTADKALTHAKEVYDGYAKDFTDEQKADDEIGIQPPPDGWFFYAVYSTEGDCIWVVEQELDRETTE